MKTIIAMSLLLVGCSDVATVSTPEDRGYLDGRGGWLNPPPTPEELNRYRIVKSDSGVLAVQKFDGREWIQKPNRWADTNHCNWDIEWWIRDERDSKKMEAETWKPIR